MKDTALKVAAPLAACCLLLSVSSPAHAYIDPVTGAFVVQGVVAGLLSVMAGVRSFRQKVIRLFSRKRD